MQCGKCIVHLLIGTPGQSYPCSSGPSHVGVSCLEAPILTISQFSMPDISPTQRISRQELRLCTKTFNLFRVLGASRRSQDCPCHGPDQGFHQTGLKILGWDSHAGLWEHKSVVWWILDLHVPAVHHYYLSSFRYEMLFATRVLCLEYWAE